jgi:hypothetical protein
MEMEWAREDAWNAVRQELVPARFDRADHIDAHLSSITRTGLLIAMSAWGGLAFKPSPLFFEVMQLVDFQEALRREASNAAP